MNRSQVVQSWFLYNDRLNLIGEVRLLAEYSTAKTAFLVYCQLATSKYAFTVDVFRQIRYLQSNYFGWESSWFLAAAHKL